MVSLASCGDGGSDPVGPYDLMPTLAAGAFLPTTVPIDLVESEEPTYWRPLQVQIGEGWTPPSPGGLWAMGRHARLQLWRMAMPFEPVLYIEHERPAQSTWQRLDTSQDLHATVLLNGVEVGVLQLPVGHGSARLPLAAGTLQEINELELRFNHPLQEEGADGRVLAVALVRVGIMTAANADALERGSTPPTHKLDPARDTLFLLSSGSYVAPLELPHTPMALELSLRYTGPPSSRDGRGELRLLVLTDDGRQHEVLALGDVTGEAEWVPQHVSLAAFAGQQLHLIIEAKLGAGDPRLALRAPHLVPDPAATSQADGAPPAPSGLSPGRPDIIIIILDAARGDHFGAHGYERDTTPRIDRLAADALVFDNAYSECPNTSCSIPNMISGLPFLDTGADLEARRVADEIVTLAEHLQGIGYHTVSFSGNPNNAIARNTSQGFDTFFQVWEGKRQRERRDPHRLSRLAAKVIADQPADQPLFLQLHYVPPHEPYDPLPAFDLFSDPDYDGIIQPGFKLRPFRDGKIVLDAKDLSQLIALYDGNLRMADDAVGKIFDALEKAGRLDDAAILITSDHGEAFLEHGEQGHNSTVFDEMLHVPFILRLPRGTRPKGVDTDRLVTLADILPTFLGMVGLEPAPEVIGLDLLHTAPDPDRPRRVFHRTAHRNGPYLSVRTPRWKTIVRPQLQEQMLFDLQSDPGERTNIIGRYPFLYTGLALELRRHLAYAESLGLDSAAAELSDEETQMLRSLGYVQ